MNSPSPQIGFDRFIQLDWATAALRVRAGMSNLDDLVRILDSSHAGPAAKKKTRTVLNRLWLEPRPDLAEFADRGVQIYRASPNTSVSTLTWGMALATYPFFGKVAEIVGRLTMLQGDCTSAEVHRRMSEIFGEREGTRRMTNMVLQSAESWGAINRIDRSRLIKRKTKTTIDDVNLASWLIEASLRYSGGGVCMAQINSTHSIFPFTIGNGAISRCYESKQLEMRYSGSGQSEIHLLAS